MTKKVGVFFILLICSTYLSFGQADSLDFPRKRKYVIGYYSDVTLVAADFSSLNNALTAQGYPALRNNYSYVSFGLSFRDKKKSAYSSIRFSFLQNRPQVFDNTRTKDVAYTGGEFSIMAQPDLIKNPNWLGYPYFGFGLGMGRLTLYDSINRPPSFTASIASLNNPIQKTWTEAFGYITVGVGVERKIKVWVYDFYVGLSGGFRLAVQSNLHEAFQIYRDSPSAKMSGLEMSLRLRFELNRLPKKSITRRDKLSGLKVY